MTIFEEIAAEIGALVAQKNEAYGSSFAKCGDFLRLLYPQGLAPEQYGDALLLVRIFDKQMRIATDCDALGESPYQDIAGYGICGVHQHHQQKEKASTWQGSVKGPDAPTSSKGSADSAPTTATLISARTTTSESAKGAPAPSPQPGSFFAVSTETAHSAQGSLQAAEKRKNMTLDELFKSIEALPLFVDADGDSVLQSWTSKLPLRHQGVLVTAIRGCDGAPKEDSSKSLSCMIRRAILNPADPRETQKAGGFFGMSHEKLKKNIPDFLHSLDQYPLHYIMHLVHASEVIGYKHPEDCYRHFFILIYRMLVHKFHLCVESEGYMDVRLTVDRIAAGTTERDF